MAPKTTTSRGCAGSLLHTFEDFDCDQEIDVQIDYHWRDYHPADEPSPIWGAEIGRVQVLAVRTFAGEAANIDSNAIDQLVEQNESELIDLCNEHGYHNNVGEYPGWYSPGRAAFVEAPTDSANAFDLRLAVSQPTRAIQAKRKSG